MIEEYQVNDSGNRQEFASGMVRDTEDGKIQWHRIYDGPMLKRYAVHLTKGAAKYPDVGGKANWMKAAGEAEYLRAKRSAARHFAQWYLGETDEDHAAATMFNINLAEYVRATKKETL